MPPEVPVDNAASTESGTPRSTSSISSGTASEAMIRAATAASSAADTPPETPVVKAPVITGAPDPNGAADPKPTAAATEQPGKDGKPAVVAAPGTSGEAPEARITAAVKNARTATTQAVLSHYGIQGAKVEDVKAGMELLQDIRRNPKDFLQRLAAELGSQPDGKEEEEEAFPAPDLESPDKRFKTYSDSTLQKMLDIHGRRIQKKLMGEMRPVLDWVGQEQGNRTEAEASAHIQKITGSVLAEARKSPHFKDNEPAILERMRAMPQELKQAIGPVGTMMLAFQQLQSEMVFPNIEAEAEKRAEAKLKATWQKKAASSSGTAHPTDQGGEGKTPQLKNVDDLAAHMERMANAAG